MILASLIAVFIIVALLWAITSGVGHDDQWRH